LPDFTFDDCPEANLLLIPGGVVDGKMTDRRVIDWIRATSSSAQWAASVCTGAFLLAKAGLLDGRQATTHWEEINDLQFQFPQVVAQEDVRWVDEGTIISSAGISAGIDMSVHLVARLVSDELAIATARQMNVPYRPQG
jgi:transcriptional regulator GlxA family with amidase domain